MTLALILLSVLILGSAIVALSLRNLIHSALLLVACWAGIAAFYLWAGAEFVAFAQGLVYVGAISMVVLFAVLLTRQGTASEPLGFASWQRFILALVAGGGVAGILVGAVLGTPLTVTTPGPVPVLTVKQIGAQLMGPHVVALLVVGILLTVSLLGAVVLAAEENVKSPEDEV
ncbi:MAG: NADH-quinone oxidoreductase subunit J [Verrucomicrobia bacterium]|nr:NADH-quinone oxidoreductase subunit J [Verrucomicrobiota bacterium]